MSTGPEGKSADENADAVANAAANDKAAADAAKAQAAADRKQKAADAKAAKAVTPDVAAPNQPAPEGTVEVTRPATPEQIEDEDTSTPAGKVTETAKAARAPRTKKDPLKGIEDFTKLPVAVHVGQVAASVEEYSGRAVFSLSLVGWVGEPPFKILADDIDELEDALANLRKQLS